VPRSVKFRPVETEAVRTVVLLLSEPVSAVDTDCAGSTSRRVIDDVMPTNATWSRASAWPFAFIDWSANPAMSPGVKRNGYDCTKDIAKPGTAGEDDLGRCAMAVSDLFQH
jgi:hypothetical protein